MAECGNCEFVKVVVNEDHLNIGVCYNPKSPHYQEEMLAEESCFFHSIPQSRKFSKGRDYELDMYSSNESEVKTRRNYLQQTNHYTQVTKLVIDGVLHYLLYKSEKPTRLRFYPLTRRSKS